MIKPFSQATLSQLRALDERTLQDLVVEPLLRAQGFENVRDNSGSGEHGKDLVAVKSEFGRVKLYAIQVKRFKLSGSITNSKSLSAVLLQLRQAAAEPVIDPSTNNKRIPDRVLFITPYKVSRYAFESALSQLQDLERRDITLIDGPILASLVFKYMPDIVTQFSMDLQYRMRFAKTVTQVPESSAFGLHYDLDLKNIFVEPGVLFGGNGISFLAEVNAKEYGPCSRLVSPDEESQFRRCARETDIKDWYRISAQPGNKRNDVTYKISVDLGALITKYQPRARKLVERLASFESRQLTDADRSEMAQQCIDLCGEVGRLLEVPFLRHMWIDATLRANPQGAGIKIPSHLLTCLRKPLYILGGPGCGKTTMMRVLCQQMANMPSGRLPVFVSLVRVREPTKQALITQCMESLSDQGFVMKAHQFTESLRSGHLVLFLDGLDEVGSMSDRMMQTVTALEQESPNCVVHVSCRDSFDYPLRRSSLPIALHGFTRESLLAFVRRWFDSEPTKAVGLHKWIEENPQMLDVARTPLVAALLCSLYQAQADMPSTEVELYENRVRLLLGEWERAKGIQPLSSSLRETYWHFLMRLAFQMHSAESRSWPRRAAVKVARAFFDKSVHREPEALVLDCIRRGLLQCADEDKLSFGHLTYQEFFVAKLLVLDDVDIWDYIPKPWWRKSLYFYASSKRDITGLLKLAIRRKIIPQALTEMIELAPFTDEKVKIAYSDREETTLTWQRDREILGWG